MMGLIIVTFPQLVNVETHFLSSPIRQGKESHIGFLVVYDLNLFFSLQNGDKTISFLVLLSRLNEIMDI